MDTDQEARGEAEARLDTELGGAVTGKTPGGKAGRVAEGRADIHTRLSPESTSKREMRLWPSRRSSYRSLMCL